MQPDELISFAQGLADAAGAVHRKYFRTPLTPERKADATPVTRADREAEEAMRALIRARHPEHGIFGEEAGREREDAPLQWVLDPIDGTRAFMAGYPTFVTLIALCENGVPVLGVIDQPILGERWTGFKGRPTLFNGKPVRVSGCNTLSEARLATTSLDWFTPAQRPLFNTIRAQTGGALYSGDAYAYAQLASGNLDVVIDAGLKPYDFCALAPVVEGAGGVMTDWRGEKVRLESGGDVVASTTFLHSTILSTLA